MKRSAHILLALLAGILLQAGLAAAGDGVSRAAADACSGSTDPQAPFSRELTDGSVPFLVETWPEPFAAACPRAHGQTTLLSDNDASSSYQLVVRARPLYLTTLRLRL